MSKFVIDFISRNRYYGFVKGSEIMLDAKDLQMIAEIVSQCIQPIKTDISNMKADISGLKADMGNVKVEVAGMKEDIANIKAEVAGMKEDIANVKAEIAGMKEDIANIKAEIADMKEDIANMKADIARLDKKTNEIQLTLENETRRNINIIAEGHAILDRKLDEALQIEHQKEIYNVRLNILEGEVRRIKEIVGFTA